MDYFDILLAKKLSGGGGGEIVLEDITITENGVVTAPSGKAYKKITTDVPLPQDAYLLKEVEDLPKDIATFSDGANLPMPSLKISIEPIQSGSGDPSPSNIRPISGFTEGNVYDDPVYGGTVAWNQLVKNGDFADTSMWGIDNGTLSVANNEATITVTNTSSASRIETTFPNIKNHKYYRIAMVNASQGQTQISWFGALAITKTANGSYQRFEDIVDSTYNDNNNWKLFIGVTNNNTASEYKVKNVMVIDLTQMFGETKANEIYAMEQAQSGSGVAYFKSLFPKDYYSYNSGEETCVSAVNGDPYTKTTISWEDEVGTVYGGTLDVVSGVLTVDRVYVKGEWTQYASNNGYKAWRKNIPNPKGSNSLCNPISNMISEFGSFSSSSMNKNIMQLNYSSGVSEITAYMALQEDTSADDVELSYLIATPTTYQLSPTAVFSLLGENNVWGDCGQITELSYFSKPSEG